jgi:hypothetical protein
VSAPAATRTVTPGSFEPGDHFYPRALNAQIHPLVRYFLGLSTDRIVNRFCHLNPRVKADQLLELLTEPPRYFRWAGSDLFLVTTEAGLRQVVVVETNSCPSGQKSMPLFDDMQEQGGFRTLLERTFLPLMGARRKKLGELAVVYDKNEMEATGYAAALADLTDEDVLLAPFPADAADPCVRFEDGHMHVRDPEGSWAPVRACFRYVTQRPWDRLPLSSKTQILNPVIACLAGGRNKLVASKAYDLFNAELAPMGLQIRTPETVWDVSRAEVPLWVARLGGCAVIKNPYSNAGQGVYTVTSPDELARFMESEQAYERFIVQALIGNHRWSSRGREGRLYHVGTMPSKQGRIYAADLRVMISSGEDGFRPLAIYARRARKPLTDALESGDESWDMLGTNLSVKLPEGGWTTETRRLMLMDNRDFNALGLGLDDLIEAFVQTALSCLAIDRMCRNLINSKGRFRSRLFSSLCDDPALMKEIAL